MSKKDVVKTTKTKKFSFSEYWITIEAVDLKEANEQLKILLNKNPEWQLTSED